MDVKIKGDFITLGQLLKITNIVSSGGEAKIAVKQMAITVNGEMENRRGRKPVSGDEVIVDQQRLRLL